MGLKDYADKRDFTRTNEPRADSDSAIAADHFVVQKHDASSTHYDLRLRVGDALASWAVPKGPSLDPREKRLAVRVEDHPVAYAEFEGTIPPGQYGAGTVMVWDRGRWSAEQDAATSLAEGMIKFRLEGRRLKGRWMLVRTTRDPSHWLLVKERDAEAAPGVHAETYATSVLTGRTMDEIARGAPSRTREAADEAPRASSLKGARATPMPDRVKPQLAAPSDRAPEGPDWFHEVKFDGYRLMVHAGRESTRIVSRGGLDWTDKLGAIAKAVADRVRVEAVLDGEAVMLDSRGVSDFQALQNAIHGRRAANIVFFAFDLPWCDGFDLTRCAIEDRRSLLASLVGTTQHGRVRFSEHVEGNGPRAFASAAAGGLEGIVSKRRGSAYSGARTPSWMKVKAFNQQEFVIGGFSAPEGSREHLGALLLGVHDAGALRFAGKVGTGFSAETLRSLARKLAPLRRATPPFSDPPTGAEARGVSWVEPVLVAQVQFRDWSADGLIRHTSFRGLREDIAPESVVREQSRTPEPLAAPPIPSIPAPIAPTPEAGTTIRLTNAERVVYPDRGAGYALTKRDIADYYAAIAPRLLAHIADHPIAVVRCPDGEGGSAFFQKHPGKGFPGAVSSVVVPTEQGGSERQLMVSDAAGVLGLVQMNALEFHVWGAPAAALETPDRLVIDLDPGDGVGWKSIVEAAGMVRDGFGQLGLTSHAMVTGGKGVHVVVALQPAHGWAVVKEFARAMADTLARLAPKRFIASATAPRASRIYVDHLRNTRGATAIAPYSTRARPGAPVALPVAWDELPGLASASAFGIAAVVRRVASGEPDPWENWRATAGRLPGAS